MAWYVHCVGRKETVSLSLSRSYQPFVPTNVDQAPSLVQDGNRMRKEIASGEASL